MKLDILALAAHPDDAELGCGGTIAKHVALGRKVGIVDFTRGELGTRGSPEIRDAEAAASAEILGLSARENLELRDGFFQNSEQDKLAIVRVIRKYRPDIVLANAIHDRHPDHGRGAQVAYEACFLSGLIKIETQESGKKQDPWRPANIFHFIQSDYIQPDFIMDISGFWETKMKAIRAFKSQFFDPSSDEPQTYISTPAFLKTLEARAHDLGHIIGATYGEGFTVRRCVGIRDLKDLM